MSDGIDLAIAQLHARANVLDYDALASELSDRFTEALDQSLDDAGLVGPYPGRIVVRFTPRRHPASDLDRLRDTDGQF